MDAQPQSTVGERTQLPVVEEVPDAPLPPVVEPHAGHDCACGVVDDPGYPELDARAVPHAIRHATVFGALEAVPAGSGLVLVAPHDPLPLLAQLEAREPETFEVSYLERGPEAWRLAIVRRAAS